MLLSVLFESCSGIIHESFRNRSLIILLIMHSGIIQESFNNHSSIIMNQAQNPSFSSPWPRGVPMVSRIPRLSFHFLSYPLFIYVLRTDNDDRHVHVHVCACVCMCVHVCACACVQHMFLRYPSVPSLSWDLRQLIAQGEGLSISALSRPPPW